MYHAVLTASLLLTPSFVIAASQCVVPPARPSNDASDAQSSKVASRLLDNDVAQIVTTQHDLRFITADEISRVPALRRIASAGAQLTDLGSQHGLRAVFARNGQNFQVFYVTADGQGAVGGVMWDHTGRNITREQVSSIEGAIPTVAIGAAVTAPRAAGQTLGTLALRTIASTTYGTTGSASAPRLWVFVDPLCSFSLRAMEQLRPFIAAGEVQVAVIPLSLLDHEGGGRSTAAAKAMLSRGAEHMVDAWTGNALTGDVDAAASATLQANMKVSEALGVRGAPTFYWRKADGSEGRQEGLPNDIGAMIASIAPAGG